MGPRPPPERRRTWKTNTKTRSQESLIRGPWQVQEEESEEEQQAGEVQCKSRRALSRNGSAGMVRFWPKFQNSKFFVLFGTPPAMPHAPVRRPLWTTAPPPCGSCRLPEREPPRRGVVRSQPAAQLFVTGIPRQY